MKIATRVAKIEQQMRVALVAARSSTCRSILTRTLGLLDWCRLILPDYCGLDFNPIHRQIAADADHFAKAREGPLRVHRPRDTGKSVIMSLALPFAQPSKGPSPYILLASETAELVEALRPDQRRAGAERATGGVLPAAAAPARSGATTGSSCETAW